MEGNLIRVGCLNVRGFKSNSDYVKKICKSCDILAISEHWLHIYDLSLIPKSLPNFFAYSMCPPPIEDDLICAPRLIRGNGGVSILWRKHLQPHVQKLTDLSTSRVVGIKVATAHRPTCFLSVYLPTRSGCTDDFKEQLDYIDAVLGQLSLDNNVIIMGDLNADPGSEGGPLSNTNANEQGKILLRYLKRWEYASVHLHDTSNFHPGHVTHTYCSEAHASLSTIDHILTPQHILHCFSNSRVEEDDPLNLSDHQFLLSDYSCHLQSVAGPDDHTTNKQPRPNWSKLTKDDIFDKYTTQVNTQLASLHLPNPDEFAIQPDLINTHLDAIADILHSTALANIPVKSFRKHLKPGWTPELSAAHNKSKRAYKAWIRAGRPRSCDHPIRKQYKDAKASFRAKLRAHQREQRDEFLCNLDVNSHSSSKLFRLLRQHNGTNSEPTATLNFRGLHTGNSLNKAWADYFSELATPTDHSDSSFADFHQTIHEKYEQLLQDPPAEVVSFSLEEVSECIDSLKVNKAAGPDDMEPEHLIYGGETLRVHLTAVFNAMVVERYVPEVFKLGMVIPIPKGHNKDLSIPGNYRGITILSNISKVFEKLLLLKISQLPSPPTLNPLQGGFQQHLSCIHSALILQEAIQSLRDKGRKAYVAFLDVKKAFDTVWHEGLFVKMHQKGISGPIWHIINRWYTSCSSAVLWNSQLSEEFPIEQGVRQGGVLSPFLYCLFVDELLDTLTSSGLGVSIQGLYCGAPMYADDLALIASSPNELQRMLDIVSQYASQWQYSLNPDKSVVMVIGEAARTRAQARESRRWLLGGRPLQEVDEQFHLGILRTVHPSTIHRTLERCTSGRSAFFALNSVGSRFGSLHPLTSYRLYNTLSVPILLYGAELWTPTKTELIMLERVHRKILRTIQGLPTRCPSSALNTMLGSDDVESRIRQRKLNFVNSVANLDNSTLAKKLLLARAEDPLAKGLIPNLNQTLDDSNLPGLVSLLSQHPTKPETWKRFTKRHSAIKSFLSFLNDCEGYHIGECDLALGRPMQHWEFTVGDPTLTRANNLRIRLLAGCEGLEKDAARFHYRNKQFSPADPSCKLCAAPCEDARHFIATCPSLLSERMRLIQNANSAIRAHLPDPLTRPEEFSNVILGVNWIAQHELQVFCIEYLRDLMSHRLDKLSKQ